MFAFIGLGNIGREYENTRHNIGFMVVDKFALVHKKSFKTGKGGFFFADVL